MMSLVTCTPPPRPCRAGSIVFMPRTEHRSSETNSTIARTTYYIAKNLQTKMASTCLRRILFTNRKFAVGRN